MSIVCAMEDPFSRPHVAGTIIFIVALLLVSGVTAYFCGVFRQRSILGPARVNPKVSLWTYFVGLAVGWLILYLGPALLLILIGGVPSAKAATQPIEERFSSEQLLMVQFLIELMVAVFLLAYTRVSNKTADLGLRTTHGGRAIVYAALGILITIPLIMASLIITQVIIEQFAPQGPLIHPMLKMLNQSTVRWEQTMIVVSAVLVAPVAEELLFRGYLQTLLGATTAQWFGDSFPAAARWAAVILTSASFAILHPQWSWGIIFLLAVCLGYAYERTGILWVPMLMHAAFNGLEVTLDWIANHPH